MGMMLSDVNFERLNKLIANYGSLGSLGVSDDYRVGGRIYSQLSQLNRVKKSCLKRHNRMTDYDYDGPKYLCPLLRHTILQGQYKFIRCGDGDSKKFKGLLHNIDAVAYQSTVVMYCQEEVCFASDMCPSIELVNAYMGCTYSFVDDQVIDTSGMADDVDEPTIITGGDSEAADLFLSNKLNGIIKFCDKQYFLKVNGIWVSDRDTIKRYLTCEALKLNYVKLNGKDEVVNYSCNISDAKRIVEAVLTKVPDCPTFVRELADSSRGKLVWKDGYYDFNTGVFTKGFDGVESTIQIPRNFPVRNEDDITELNTRFLDPVFGDLKTSFLQYLSQCMAGYSQKMWSVLMGERDSGKSKLITLLSTAFDGYCIVVGANNLIKVRGDTSEPSKKLAWAIGMEFARMACTSEIRIDATSCESIDGVLIKLITGQDGVQIRVLYCHDRVIYIQAGFMICCNDIARVSPTDTYETLVPFNLPTKFIPKPVDEVNPSPPYPFMKWQDPSIGDFVRLTRIGDALFWLLVDNFQAVQLTKEMVIFKEQFMEVDEFKIILDHFVVTSDSSDFVENDVIKKFLRTSRMNITSPKFKDYLIKRGAREHQTSKNQGHKRGLSYLKIIKEFKIDDL